MLNRRERGAVAHICEPVQRRRSKGLGKRGQRLRRMGGHVAVGTGQGHWAGPSSCERAEANLFGLRGDGRRKVREGGENAVDVKSDTCQRRRLERRRRGDCWRCR
jgi:hypothetical protein